METRMSLRATLARSSIIAAVFLTTIASAQVNGSGGSQSPPPPIAIQFGKQSVTVTASPGGQVALFSVAREFVRPKLHVLGVVRRSVVLSDAAKSGVFTLGLG